MRHLFVCAATVAASISACSGSTSQDLQDAGEDVPGSSSTHVHSQDSGAHGHGDPGGVTASHAHGLTIAEAGRVLWATHGGVFEFDPSDPVPNALISGPDFHSLIVDPHDSNRLWASGSWTDQDHESWGFVESTDGGRAWTNVSLDGELIFEVLTASATREGLIAGVADGAVWYSRDSGRNWNSFDWPGECTGIVIVEPDEPRFLLSGVWGVLEVSAGGEERENRFSGPVTDLDRWPGGILYAIAGSIVACGSDIQQTDECVALRPPGAHPIRQVANDSARDTWYVLTSGPDLYRRVGDTVWELLATGL